MEETEENDFVDSRPLTGAENAFLDECTVPARSMIVAETEITRLRNLIAEKDQALEDADKAISTLALTELGYVERSGFRWPLRNELLTRIRAAKEKT